MSFINLLKDKISYQNQLKLKYKLRHLRAMLFPFNLSKIELLDNIISEIGEIDLIINDGSHINKHVIESFKYLFPKLKNRGIYVVEDTQTSYWKDYGGNSNNFDDKNTTCGFFKSLIDSLNNEEFTIDNYSKNYYDKHIISMHFYHNMIFSYKGDNNESSNYIVKNKKPNG